jgi:hypothetical protein
MRKMRILLGLLLAVVVLATLGVRPCEAKPKKPPCAQNLAACGDEGCGSDFDPNLNRQKNIRADDPRAQGAATPRTITWMKDLADPENFVKGGSREELAQLGEGQKISVVAYVLVARAEPGGESCNCGLHKPAETDNHLVLVSKATRDRFPLPTDGSDTRDVLKAREAESQTAEFTPRVRLSHANFTREKVQPLIDADEEEALLVRVTGLLLFDSEHFLRNHLLRVNNWEIHPVLKFEFCTTDACTATSDEGWKSLDDL